MTSKQTPPHFESQMPSSVGQVIGGIKSLFVFRLQEWDSAVLVVSQLLDDLAQRLLMSLVVFLILLFVGDYTIAAIWCGVVAVNETIEVITNRRLIASSQPSRWLMIVHCLNWIMGGSTWTVTSLYLVATGTIAEILLGMVMLIGAMLHIVFNYADWLKGLFYAASPLVLGLLSLPLVSRFDGAGAHQYIVLTVAYTGLLFYLFFAVYQNIKRHAAFKRALEASALASESKSAFLANMSHEIRTPMNGVLGMTKLLKRTELNSEQGELVDIIDDSGETLLRVIGDVLDLSKVEAGKLELEYAPFMLEDVLKTIIATAEIKAIEKGLRFVFVKPDDTNVWLLGDEIRIRQIINNLISNAIKFTEAGEVSLNVFLGPVAGKEHVLLIAEVNDTGEGISPEHAMRVFEPFVQQDPSLSRNQTGAGLGLTISRHLAELMGGDIRLISRKGSGAKFIFTLELTKCAPDEQERLSRRSDDQSEVTIDTGIRVLVVDDHKQNQLVIRKMLEAIGLTPTIASSGEEGVGLYRKDEFDLVLMDIQMPGMNGIEALKHIRDLERQGSMRRTPVVAVTANAMKHQVDHYMWEGFDDHMPKPISLGKLVRVISSVTRN